MVQNQGCDIKWAHIVELSENAVANTALYVGKHLTREHLNLTSYSRMNVRLAAQVFTHSNVTSYDMMILYYITRCLVNLLLMDSRQ